MNYKWVVKFYGYLTPLMALENGKNINVGTTKSKC